MVLYANSTEDIFTPLVPVAPALKKIITFGACVLTQVVGEYGVKSAGAIVSISIAKALA